MGGALTISFSGSGTSTTTVAVVRANRRPAMWIAAVISSNGRASSVNPGPALFVPMPSTSRITPVAKPRVEAHCARPPTQRAHPTTTGRAVGAGSRNETNAMSATPTAAATHTAKGSQRQAASAHTAAPRTSDGAPITRTCTLVLSDGHAGALPALGGNSPNCLVFGFALPASGKK